MGSKVKEGGHNSKGEEGYTLKVKVEGHIKGEEEYTLMDQLEEVE